MKTTRRTAMLALLSGLLLWSTGGSPAEAAKGWADARLSFTTTGNGNPDLIYHVTGTYKGGITQYNLIEALAPVTFQGTLFTNVASGGGAYYCNASGLVKNENFSCQRKTTMSCPLAQGSWTGRARMVAAIPPFGVVWTDPSGTLYTNCPPPEPPGCNGSISSTKLLAVDLDTGRVTRPEWPFEAPSGLRRSSMVDGKPYFLEEWALLDTRGTGGAMTLAASSGEVTPQVAGWADALSATPGFRAGARYLVIEAARHINNRTEPLVLLDSLRSGRRREVPLPDGRVVFRAGFSAAGELEGVQVVDGSQRAAAILAEDLRVEFPRLPGASEHDDHRSIVFATFDVVDGRPHFVAAVPLLPQCCCTGSWCI